MCCMGLPTDEDMHQKQQLINDLIMDLTYNDCLALRCAEQLLVTAAYSAIACCFLIAIFNCMLGIIILETEMSIGSRL